MSEVSIFKDKSSAVAVSGQRELSPLAKSLAAATTNRRIQTNTNGTFKRLINGEQIGNAVRGEINVIIVDALPKVSRTYYAKAYDPSAEATLPDCWSNLGDKPEAAASNKQHANCADCPQNVKGSGGGERRACRFQRRVAVMLENDASGDVYQFNIPSKSLFGKGAGNVHPFESYTKFLAGNGLSIDAVVTNISYDSNADSMELLFTPLREISDDEFALVQAAQAKPETHAVTMLNVTQSANKKGGAAPAEAKEEPKKAKVERSDEPDEDAPVSEPTKRKGKTAAPQTPGKSNLTDAISNWGKDE